MKALAALLLLPFLLGAAKPVLVPDVSQRDIEIAYSFTGADLLLFGAFLAWAVADFRAARQRDRAAGTVYPAGSTAATLHTVLIGLLAWAALAFWGHAALIGVRPFG